MILEPIPKHIAKAVELFQAGKLKAADITTVNNKDFEISLDTFDVFGDPGPPHTFSLSAESLASTKVLLENALNKAIAAVDSYDKIQKDVLAMIGQVEEYNLLNSGGREDENSKA